MGRPGYEMAAGDGRGCLRAAHADRERVIDTLKAAYVYGLVTKNELDERLSQTFAARTHAQLAVITADIPSGLAPVKASTGKGQCSGSREGPRDHGHRHSHRPGLGSRIRRESGCRARAFGGGGAGGAAVCRRDLERFRVLGPARYPDALAANPAPGQAAAAAASESRLWHERCSQDDICHLGRTAPPRRQAAAGHNRRSPASLPASAVVQLNVLRPS